jgi:hypothetical protein
MNREELAARIKEIGFSCTRCGECCKGTKEDSNLVMVFPHEIDDLAGGTGLQAGDFSEPYPEKVQTRDGGSITFEWCLKRTTRGCIFHDGAHCTAYASRPWICRTYPFMLSKEGLFISPCKGIGGEITSDESESIAGLLMARMSAEQEEERRIQAVLSSSSIPADREVLIDGTGVRVL